MHRRTVLAATVVGLSGCQGSTDDDGSGSEATRTDDASESGTPRIDCQRASRPAPESDSSGTVEPREYPTPPAGQADVEWVVAHESAYRVNSLLGTHDLTMWSGLTVHDSEREQYGNGVVVRVLYEYSYQYGAETEVIADPSNVTAAYYVDERGALRWAEEGHELASDVDPAVNGRPVVCF